MSFLRKVPIVVMASVIVATMLIALVLLVPAEHRGQVITPVSFIVAAILMVGMSVFSWSQHSRALVGKRLKWLLDQGLTIEQHGAYRGIKGTYRNYFIRVYVDPSSHFHRRLGPDLCLLVYFHPMRTREGKRDIALLRGIESDLLNETSWIHREDLKCHAIHMHQYTRFTIWVSRKKVQKRIDKVVDRVMHYGLRPWSEEEVDKWVREDPILNGPDIDSFQAALAARKQ